jgi:Xaa-Pro dipeptidase
VVPSIALDFLDERRNLRGRGLTAARVFSESEMDRRWAATREAMRTDGLDALLLFANRATPHEVLHLTGFMVSHEAALLFPIEGEPALFVSYFNHLPTARRHSVVEDVRWLGDDAIATVGAELELRRLARGSIGIAGTLQPRRYESLDKVLDAGRCIDFGPRLAAMRLVKSDEELDVLRRAGQLCDRAQAALESEAHIGMSEYELVALVEQAYVPSGGSTHIHFIGTTSMQSPDLCCPSQLPSDRRLAAGDVVLTELSAQLSGYYGQVLRTATVAADPTEHYQRMHKVALQAFERIIGVLRDGATGDQVLDAAECIHDSGFTICDDLLHFAVGAYSPHLRTRQTSSSIPEIVFRENMVVVVQPNVSAADLRSGVQVGHMVRITSNGVEQLHHHPLRIGRID